MEIACNLLCMTPEQRSAHSALVRKIGAAIIERQESETVLEFSVDEARVSPSELESWIILERQCCPFFTLDLSEANGVRIEAPAGVKPSEIIGF